MEALGESNVRVRIFIRLQMKFITPESNKCLTYMICYKENMMDFVEILLINSGSVLGTSHLILTLHFSVVEGNLYLFAGCSVQDAEDCLPGIYSYDLSEYKSSK